MKILHVMAGASVGGAEIFFVDALAALNHAKIEQYVITRSSDVREQQIADMDIPVKTASFNKIVSWPTKSVIRRAINDFKPDIVQYWMSRAASFAVSGDHINVGWYSSNSDVKRFQKCQYHIGVTPEVQGDIIRQGVAPDQTFSLPIYTHDPLILATSRQSVDTPAGAPLLLSLARLHPVKGLDVLLKAMVKIPAAYLWIAGSGPLEAELKAQAEGLCLMNRVRFLGWREDKEALMAAADFCVFPSRNDSFGAVMIEAWASGKPLIATKAPGPKAYIRHDQDGVLVEIDDVDGLADAINNVIDHPDLAARLSEGGRARYEKDFTQKAFINNAIRIYEAVLRG